MWIKVVSVKVWQLNPRKPEKWQAMVYDEDEGHRGCLALNWVLGTLGKHLKWIITAERVSRHSPMPGIEGS